MRDQAPAGASVGGHYHVGIRNDGAVCVLASPERFVACGEYDDAEIPRWRLSYPTDSGHVVVGLVPDGYTDARIVQSPKTQATVVDNLYVIRSTNLTTVEVFDGNTWYHVSPPTVGVLQRPQDPRDVLPDSLLRLPIEYGTPAGLNPATVRFTGEFDGERYWASGGAVALCLHGTPDQARCVSSEDSSHRGAIVIEPSTSGGTWARHLAGLVDDGFETATVGSAQVSVVNNVFIFEGRPSGDRLILSGKAGTRVVDISGRGG